jgi:hypothetical protein
VRAVRSTCAEAIRAVQVTPASKEKKFVLMMHVTARLHLPQHERLERGLESRVATASYIFMKRA